MSAGSSAYSPLPQSNSDSDGSSEEELHVSRENRIINRAAKVRNSTGDKGYNEQKNNVINYKPLDNNSDVGIALNKFQSSLDEVSVLKPDANVEIFSTSRKIWFVLSLLLCVFTTVAFIWLLPCNVDSCPSASDLKKHNFTWEDNLPNLEIFGPITLAPDKGGSQNLILLTNSYSHLKKNSSEIALMCLKGRDGSLKWKIELDKEATDLDCKLVDINVDGISDCLIHGRNVLRAVNPVSGEELWDIQRSNRQEEIYFKEFPLIIPDLNTDEVKELLLSCSFPTSDLGISFQNYLVIISGKTGEIINKPFQINSCSQVKDLVLESNSTLSFNCFNSDNKVSFKKMSLTILYKTLKSGNINIFNWILPSQHVEPPATVHVNGFRLNMENQGDCPENCVMYVDIRDGHQSANNKTLFHFSRKSTFGMAPLVLKTKKETGFILKFWKWHSETEKSHFQNDAQFSAQKVVVIKDGTRNLIKRSKKLNNFLDSSKILENEMLSESEWESQQLKRTASRRRVVRSEKGAFNSGAFNLHVITESIIKLNVNKSHLVISNVTKDEIIQICRKPGICQPNVHKQRHSVLIADLAKDEEEKLITFSSKYVHNNDKSNKNSEDWFLQSRIRVLNF